MRFQGRITTWHDEKGFGYITKNIGGTPLFVHIKGFRDGQRRPLGGELVTYEQAHDDRGRARAANVSFVSFSKPTKQTKGAGAPTLVLACGFLLALVLGAWAKTIPWMSVAAYTLVSATTFLAYSRDKSAAQKGRWRTPESRLQLMALLGGWPGAAIAQVWLRHKSQKLSFRFVFWAMAIIHCAAVSWMFFSKTGQVWLESAFGAGI